MEQPLHGIVLVGVITCVRIVMNITAAPTCGCGSRYMFVLIDTPAPAFSTQPYSSSVHFCRQPYPNPASLLCLPNPTT